ncbi:flagellar hook-length control protein FliK [Pseudooceanicola nanhaiensis]|uniref:flagellar hook-length control protein FliK n=1 Tax=Pseudooceanicola nanhaiensis TaxID=375761 RepID=UPI001CD6BBB7|nr:flagellar hook-length control protein FliK [Pseudooceanicola nanhaiensis]MCA0920384.1 flagellar hook-length control protein FliK [Pseudooceanicola nanhaiensis]
MVEAEPVQARPMSEARRVTRAAENPQPVPAAGPPVEEAVVVVEEPGSDGSEGPEVPFFDGAGRSLTPVEPRTTGLRGAEPAMPRQIAAQIAMAARQIVERPVEICLQPEELGHVRLHVQPTEGGVILSITVERQETLDLMRRHAEPLARELLAEGYQDVQLSFSQGRSDDRGDGEASPQGGQPDRTAEAPGRPVADVLAAHGAIMVSGLDLRL